MLMGSVHAQSKAGLYLSFRTKGSEVLLTQIFQTAKLKLINKVAQIVSKDPYQPELDLVTIEKIIFGINTN